MAGIAKRRIAPDPWTGRIEYSRETHYTQASDDKGHYLNVQVHVPTTLAALITNHVNSQAWPDYHSMQDVIRDAIYHHMHWLGKHPKGVDPQAIADEIFQAGVENRRVRIKRYEQMIEVPRRALEELIEAGDWDEFRSTLEQARQQMEMMPDPYRTRMETLVSEYSRRVE